MFSQPIQFLDYMGTDMLQKIDPFNFLKIFKFTIESSL